MSRRRSSYRRNPAPCTCGATYADLRTGLTFREVRDMMFNSSDDPAMWIYRRRHGVLGYWRALKLMMWDGEHGGCQ